MIPLKLEFQAFGSYVKRQTVDFTSLQNGDIFLINGKTGSGKTTIIDAMVFALYSKGSGSDRNTLADMRSKSFGAENIPTETSFTFEAKGKTYKFERRCFVRTKKKRDGTTEQVVDIEQNAFELTNDGFMPVFDNPKGKDLDSLAEEIIGLNHEQFTKVMVLPQGKFESFLVASSAEKEQILSTLFNVEKWRKIADWICQNAISIGKDATRCDNNCKETLKRYDCNSITELDELYNNSCQRLTEVLKEIDTVEKTSVILNKKKEDALVVENDFLQLEKLEKGFAEFENQRGYYENLKQEIVKNKNALEIEPYYNFCKQYYEELKIRSNNCEQVKTQLSDAQQLSKKYEKLLEEINSKADEITGCRVKLEMLNTNRDNFSALAQQKQQLCDFRKRVCDNNEKLEKTNALIKNLDADITASENELKTASDKLSQIGVLTKKKEQIDSYKTFSQEIIKLSDDITKNNNDIKKYTLELDDNNKKLSQLLAHRDMRYNSYITNLASAVSGSLKEGEPCPVCGSIHHPSPAVIPEDFATREEIQALDNEIDLFKNRILVCNNKISDLKSRNEEFAKQLDLKNESISKLVVFDEQEKNQIISDYNASMKAGEVMGGISDRLNHLKSQKAGLTADSESIKSLIDAEKQEILALDAKINMRTEDMLKLGITDFTDMKQYDGYIAELTKAVNDYDREKQNTEALCKNHSTQVVTLTKSIQIALLEVEKAKQNLSKAQNDYVENMKKKGFADKEEFKAFNISSEELESKQNSYDEFVSGYNSHKNQLLQLRQKLLNIQRPDILKLSDEIKQAEGTKNALLSEKSVLVTNNDTLKKDIDYYNENFKDYNTYKHDSDRLMSFGKDIRGDNSVGLRRYVLGVMLDKIINEANIILREIKGGQFSLFVNREKEGGKKQFGLEIYVSSSHTEHPYSVRSLSGGEKFLVAMALSMALSSIVQMCAGGTRIDALFIDEGFGTLDNDVLNDAMNVLSSLGQSRKVLGIISHVDILKEAIPKKINVKNTSDGSQLFVDF